jgi:hypothetical protein
MKVFREGQVEHGVERVAAVLCGDVDDRALFEGAVARLGDLDHVDLVPFAVEEAEHSRRGQLGSHGVAKAFVGEHGFQRRALYAERGLPARQALHRVRRREGVLHRQRAA